MENKSNRPFSTALFSAIGSIKNGFFVDSMTKSTEFIIIHQKSIQDSFNILPKDTDDLTTSNHLARNIHAN